MVHSDPNVSAPSAWFGSVSAPKMEQLDIRHLIDRALLCRKNDNDIYRVSIDFEQNTWDRPVVSPGRPAFSATVIVIGNLVSARQSNGHVVVARMSGRLDEKGVFSPTNELASLEVVDLALKSKKVDSHGTSSGRVLILGKVDGVLETEKAQVEIDLNRLVGGLSFKNVGAVVRNEWHSSSKTEDDVPELSCNREGSGGPQFSCQMIDR